MVAGALAIFGFIIGMIWFWAWVFSCLSESKSDKKNTNASNNIIIEEPEESEEDRCYREYGEYYDQSYYF